jgi:YggT family protein
LTFWRLLSAVIVVYIVILSLRILLSWFQGSVGGKPRDVLIRITDPYLALFSRLRFLRQGMFDFTPIAAILVLVVALDLINKIQRFGRITLGIFLGSLTGAVWSGFAFLLVLFLILALARVILMIVRPGRETHLSTALSMMVEPVVAIVRRILPTRRSISELNYLLLTIGMLFVLRLLGGYLIRILVGFFHTLPI